MTDEIPTMMDIAYVDGLIHDLQRGGHVVKLVKVGASLREAFIEAAGDAYSEDAYLGIPVTFDAIDPEGVNVESEPA